MQVCKERREDRVCDCRARRVLCSSGLTSTRIKDLGNSLIEMQPCRKTEHDFVEFTFSACF